MPLRKFNVLIVDDNASDRLMAKSILKKLHLKTIHEAENGVVAEAKLLRAAEMKDPYDIVVVDWNMPGMNGLKLLQFIRSEPKLKNPKVLMITAESKKPLVQEAISSGVSDFIVKPLKLDIVEEKLRKILLQ